MWKTFLCHDVSSVASGYVLCLITWRPYNIHSKRCAVTHCSNVTMGAMASQITGASIVCSIVCWIHRWPMVSSHEGPVTRKMLRFDDIIVEEADMIFRIQATAIPLSVNSNTIQCVKIDFSCLLVKTTFTKFPLPLLSSTIESNAYTRGKV